MIATGVRPVLLGNLNIEAQQVLVPGDSGRL